MVSKTNTIIISKTILAPRHLYYIYSRKKSCSILEINIKSEHRLQQLYKPCFSSWVHPGWKCKHSWYVRCFEWKWAWKGIWGRESHVCLWSLNLTDSNFCEEAMKQTSCWRSWNSNSRWVHEAVCCVSNQNTLWLTDVIIDFTQRWSATVFTQGLGPWDLRLRPLR